MICANNLRCANNIAMSGAPESQLRWETHSYGDVNGSYGDGHKVPWD